MQLTIAVGRGRFAHSLWRLLLNVGTFSKGAPTPTPRRPGRKPGRAYGPRAWRPVPAHIDAVVEVLPPAPVLIKGYAEKQRLPVMYSDLSAAEAGGLVAYGIRSGANFEKGAQFVDHILKGAKPADLPFEQVGNYYLYVNTRAAKAIGITIPASVLMQATKVIE